MDTPNGKYFIVTKDIFGLKRKQSNIVDGMYGTYSLFFTIKKCIAMIKIRIENFP